ncbi:glucodextranase DOMON-like domain-containing protein [Deinococcus irradiatisoli]|uniref:glucodextranase DOMON-like domain-containing protein n=1 Tax=Deinococcus irradiatisoli TaxID=2202254 RepID=UPI0015E82EE1|nr:glucodextranase DOMON-like domain-containing protein [Deinococcus irradiatisoli]
MLSLLAALLPAALLLSVPDPAGDANGDGSYLLPTRPSLSAAALDLRSFKAENVAGKLRLSTALGAVSNPWNAPTGFSGLTLDIFVKTAPGGARELSGLGLQVPGASGWQEHYRFNGFSAQHFSADASGRPALQADTPQAQVQGTDLVLDTGLPAGAYSYWVTSSLYTPFSADGILRPGGDTTPSSLRSARAGTPAPLDVLQNGDQKAVYATGILDPVGQTLDPRALGLLGLAAAGLVAAAVLGVLAWRRGA